MNILIRKISFCSVQYANEIYTNLYSNNALILLRIRPRINHFPLLITLKGFCKQCIQVGFSQSLAQMRIHSAKNSITSWCGVAHCPMCSDWFGSLRNNIVIA